MPWRILHADSFEGLEEALRGLETSVSGGEDEEGRFRLSADILEVVPLGRLVDDVGIAVNVRVNRSPAEATSA